MGVLAWFEPLELRGGQGARVGVEAGRAFGDKGSKVNSRRPWSVCDQRGVPTCVCPGCPWPAVSPWVTGDLSVSLEKPIPPLLGRDRAGDGGTTGSERPSKTLEVGVAFWPLICPPGSEATQGPQVQL